MPNITNSVIQKATIIWPDSLYSDTSDQILEPEDQKTLAHFWA